MNLVRDCAAVTVAVGLFLCAGCAGGTDGPPRIPVHGKVTVKGKPVPGGNVRIVPAPGSSGVGGSTSIINGEYSFTRETGPQAGKYQLVVNLADVAAPPPTSKYKNPKPGLEPEPAGNVGGIQLPGDQAEFTFELDVPAEGEVEKDVNIE